jgi:alpha-tubulin suppressor-like RCC1 family protein/PKD repeat protein
MRRSVYKVRSRIGARTGTGGAPVRALVVVCALAAVVSTAGALASTGSEALTAAPSENLPDTGPTPVVLTGVGFEPGLVGAIQQCSTRGACVQFDDAVVEPDGSFSTTVDVSYDFGGGGSFCYTSSTNLCELVFIPYTGEGAGLVLASVPITFAGGIKQKPVAVLTATPSSGTRPLTVQLDGSESYDPDPDGIVSQYFWEFGDGTTEEGSPSESGVTSHLYGLPGEYTVRMTVTDTHGDSDTATQLVTVTDTSNTPPNAFIYDTYPSSVAVGEEVLFNFYGNDLEGGVDLMLRFEGEGTTAPFLGDENSTSATHVYTQPGSYTPDLFVTDEDGARTVYRGLHAIEVTEAGPIPIVLDPPAPPEGGVWAWGRGAEGSIGNGTTPTYQTTAAKVSVLSDADQIGAGASHGLALVGGEVWAWGNNEFGQLGDSTTVHRSIPVKVSGLSGVDEIAAGGLHNLALVDGQVWAWGYNSAGQLGNGTCCTARTSPVRVNGLSGVDAISVGGEHSLALVDGEVWAWGANDYGELGQGATSRKEVTPRKVIGLNGVDAIDAGFQHSFALVDGEVWGWGKNDYGALGTGSVGIEVAPVKAVGLSGVDTIRAGGGHSLALVDGEVWAWGAGNIGQLGNDTRSSAQTPLRVSALTGVDAIDTSGSTSLALVDGEVWAWGYGLDGQLGNGSTTYAQTTPGKVSALTGVDKIASGWALSVASGTASPTNGTLRGTANVAADATVTTDVDADGATAEDPVELAVTTPVAGPVSVVKSTSISLGDASIGGRAFVGGRALVIEAPNATIAEPLVLTFTLDVSIFPIHYPLETLCCDFTRDVTLNGSFVTASCTGPSAADPDPCIASRTRRAGGDVEVVVRTSHASEWAVFIRGANVDAGGPYSVAEGSSITLNGSAAGGAAPYSLLWDLVPGLDNPFVASPTFAGLDDRVVALRLTAVDSLGIPGEDESQVTVTNALPSLNPLSLPASAAVNEQVSLQAVFSDAGVADTHTATVNWGDGTTQQMTVAEQNGAGTANKTHAYTAAGVKTVTVTVTDDDGGQRQSQQSIRVLYGCVGPTPSGAIVRGTGNDTINGTEGDDVIVDTGGSNTINGRGGNDVICSGSGNDAIDAGSGNDLVVDKGGSNTVAGGGGNDQITAGNGNDAIDSGTGDDTIGAGNGNNTLVTGDGSDRITTGSGNDKIDSGAGNDTIQAGDGNNTVTAGSGDDTITAGSGSDSVDGGIGFDRCNAGGGKNTIKNCEA